jgi:hypothetical protein
LQNNVGITKAILQIALVSKGMLSHYCRILNINQMKKYVETEIKNLRHQLDGMQCGSCNHSHAVRLSLIVRAGESCSILLSDK